MDNTAVTEKIYIHCAGEIFKRDDRYFRLKGIFMKKVVILLVLSICISAWANEPNEVEKLRAENAQLKKDIKMFQQNNAKIRVENEKLKVENKKALTLAMDAEKKLDAQLIKKGKLAEFFMWPEEIQKTIKEKKVSVGMTKEQVLLSWGKPKEVNSDSNKYGTSEQWVYSVWGGNYLYFDNGTLSSIQTSGNP